MKTEKRNCITWEAKKDWLGTRSEYNFWSTSVRVKTENSIVGQGLVKKRPPLF